MSARRPRRPRHPRPSELRPLTLESLYPVPRPYDSLEQHERTTHRDLGRLSRAELMRERDRLRLRLLLDDEPDAWLFERWCKLEGVLGGAR